MLSVIKRRAPNGALRRERVVLTVDGQLVIKRRAPNGALRRRVQRVAVIIDPLVS